MEITTINDNILKEIRKNKRRAVRQFKKGGYITIDGVINQYNPITCVFIPIADHTLVSDFKQLMGNTWNTISNIQIIDLLQNELPKLTESNVVDFKLYNEQSQVIINEELLQDLLKAALTENKQFQRDMDFKGRKDLISQITVLRNNNIFTDNKRRLFKFKDGEFLRYTSNDIVGILNADMGTDDNHFALPQVKNHFKDYSDNLTDVTNLIKLMNAKRYKELTLKDCKPGFDEVLKIVSKFGGA